MPSKPRGTLFTRKCKDYYRHNVPFSKFIVGPIYVSTSIPTLEGQ